MSLTSSHLADNFNLYIARRANTYRHMERRKKTPTSPLSQAVKLTAELVSRIKPESSGCEEPIPAGDCDKLALLIWYRLVEMTGGWMGGKRSFFILFAYNDSYFHMQSTCTIGWLHFPYFFYEWMIGMQTWNDELTPCKKWPTLRYHEFKVRAKENLLM